MRQRKRKTYCESFEFTKERRSSCDNVNGEIVKERESVGTTNFGLKGPAVKGYA